MKDAKGHGSEARGGPAHGSGVDQVGRSVKMAFSKIKPQDYMDPRSERVVNFRGMIRRGQELEPLVVDPKGNLIDGNHRYAAYKAEKVKSIPVRISTGGLEPW